MKIAPLARALAFLVPGLVITFLPQDHSAKVGMLSLAGFGLGFALLPALVLVLAGRFKQALTDGAPLWQKLLALSLAPIALLMPVANQAFGFRLAVAYWGLVAAAGAFFKWRASAGNKQARSSQAISAGLGLLLAAIVGLVPLTTRNVVGFFGIYLVICAIHLGIDALGPEAQAKDAQAPDASQKLQ